MPVNIENENSLTSESFGSFSIKNNSYTYTFIVRIDSR